MKIYLPGILEWFYLSGHCLSKDFVFNSVITFLLMPSQQYTDALLL